MKFEDLTDREIPGATFAEAPIYRAGDALQPWQRAFVTEFLDHREAYGKARLLLADEVGVGKTLSLASSAIVACLLGDGPVLILCPANLCLQWQTEILDKLGVPSTVWSSERKVWIDYRGHTVATRGAEDIAGCPTQIAIVSTGLIVQNSEECEHLRNHKYGIVILDEAHNARRKHGAKNNEKPTKLLSFMLDMGERTRHMLLGTATPIQTETHELWDLLEILANGAEFVLGAKPASRWANPKKALKVVTGEARPESAEDAWEWLRNPLAPASEHENVSGTCDCSWERHSARSARTPHTERSSWMRAANSRDWTRISSCTTTQWFATPCCDADALWKTWGS